MARPGYYQVFEPGSVKDKWMIAGAAMFGIPPSGEITEERAIQLGFLLPIEKTNLPEEQKAAAPGTLVDAGGAPWPPDSKPAVDTKAVRQALLDEATNKGRAGINESFTKYGLDPSKYSSNIEGRIASTLAGIPNTTTEGFDPFFSGLGDKLLGDLERPYRSSAKDAFSSRMPKDWIAQTADDAFIESILGEQRSEADTYVKNMLDRGSITQQGADAAYADLDTQGTGGRSRLSEIGSGLINTGEGNVDAEQARRAGAYDTLKFDQPYNVEEDFNALNTLANDFIGTLGTGIRSGLGSTKLYNTAGLGSIAGAAQGGQNTKFDTGAGGGQSTAPGMPQYIPDEDKLGQEVLF
jgi:hypothetical protein